MECINCNITFDLAFPLNEITAIILCLKNVNTGMCLDFMSNQFVLNLVETTAFCY